ncbi:hypothetical protein OD350_28655 (plasmid) [Clostridium beijerinckii]|uniref:hypothetical protein n=1 Tax=Clostridium beijerinckii TaxID=1520 RepID=UPI00222668C0|nr:hypothetical protein [Clostridium beijerinckii]UYZ39045.1 hypothetical protein OD350_28655 [Clostridium beijerinckii]
MDRIVIAYSRHDNLGDKYSDNYKFEARKLIDNITDEIREMKDTVIKSLSVEMKEIKWEESGDIEPVYSLRINEKYLLQFGIRELTKIADVKKIGKRLNEIILTKMGDE